MQFSNLSYFSMYAYQPPPPPPPTLLFDLGLGLIDAENIDVALTKNAKTFFVAINLIVNLNSFHY